MHRCARVLAAALFPSLAAAQEAPAVAVPQQAPQNVSAPAAATARGTVADTASAGRVLVLDCPATDRPRTAADSVGAGAMRTSSLIATLCARTRNRNAGNQGRVRELQLRSDSLIEAVRQNQQGPAHDPSHGGDPVGLEKTAEPQMRLHAFADIRYASTDSGGSRNGFALGQFDLFLRSQLSDNLSVLSEVVMTATPRNQFNTKLERLLLTFSPSDYFTASVGRFHTGIGYYNATYHHGTWFQTATGRPLVFSTEGDIGIVPIHTLGITATGDIPSGGLGLRYLAEVGSGRAGQSNASIAPQPTLTDNNTASVNLGLIARPERVDGMQVGVSVYRNRLTMQDTAYAPVSETVTAAHALYKTDVVEMLSEAVYIRHSPRGAAPGTAVRGGYALLSRRFGDLRPYARYDYVDVPRTNYLFGYLGRRSGPTVGLRYDFDALAALKVQIGHMDQTTRATINRFETQVAFMF